MALRLMLFWCVLLVLVLVLESVQDHPGFARIFFFPRSFPLAIALNGFPCDRDMEDHCG